MTETIEVRQEPSSSREPSLSSRDHDFRTAVAHVEMIIAGSPLYSIYSGPPQAQRRAHRADLRLLLSDNERMRKALEAVLDSGSDGEHSGDRHARCRDIARSALKGEG
jgi:hypothetical protein